MKKIILALAALLLATNVAWAQNPTCPDRPKGDSTNACANTRFVITNGATLTPGTVTNQWLRWDGSAWGASTTLLPNSAAQGDLMFGSAANTFSTLAKSTSVGRYIKNSGTSNNPAWSALPMPFINVLDYATCNGVADDTAAFSTIASLIGSTITDGGDIYFPKGADCRVTSWNMSSKINVRIHGPSGFDNNRNNTFAARLTCTTTGAGVCFDFSNAEAITFENMEFSCNQATFTGTLFTFSQTASTQASIKFAGVQLHQSPGTSCVPGVLVYLGNAVHTHFENVHFEAATVGIAGALTAETKDSAFLTCYGCFFVTMQTAAVLNPGPYWSFIGSWFFAKANGDALGVLQTNATLIQSLNFTDTIFSDGTTANGIWIDLDAASDVRQLSITGGSFGGGARAVKTRDTTGMHFQAQVISITNGIEFTGVCDGIHVGGSFFSVTGNPYTGSTCTNSVFAGNSGANSNLTTGTGSIVYSTSPTLTTPNIGAATGTSLTLTGGVISVTFNQNAATNGLTVTNSDGGGSATATIRAIGSGGTLGNSAVGVNASYSWSGNGTLFINASHANGNLSFQAGSGAERLRIDQVGRFNFTTNAPPTASSCGTSPTVSGNHTKGFVTMGTGSPTGCTLTWATAYNTTPQCVVTWRSNLSSMTYTTSTTALTLTQTGTSSNTVDWLCFGT